jgi:hypothetical protein
MLKRLFISLGLAVALALIVGAVYLRLTIHPGIEAYCKSNPTNDIRNICQNYR